MADCGGAGCPHLLARIELGADLRRLRLRRSRELRLQLRLERPLRHKQATSDVGMHRAHGQLRLALPSIINSDLASFQLVYSAGESVTAARERSRTSAKTRGGGAALESVFVGSGGRCYADRDQTQFEAGH